MGSTIPITIKIRSEIMKEVFAIPIFACVDKKLLTKMIPVIPVIKKSIQGKKEISSEINTLFFFIF